MLNYWNASNHTGSLAINTESSESAISRLATGLNNSRIEEWAQFWEHFFGLSATPTRARGRPPILKLSSPLSRTATSAGGVKSGSVASWNPLLRAGPVSDPPPAQTQGQGHWLPAASSPSAARSTLLRGQLQCGLAA